MASPTSDPGRAQCSRPAESHGHTFVLLGIWIVVGYRQLGLPSVRAGGLEEE